MLSKYKKVQIDLVNTLGQSVLSIHKGDLAAGQHTFSVSVADLSAGVYFARVQSGCYAQIPDGRSVPQCNVIYE